MKILCINCSSYKKKHHACFSEDLLSIFKGKKIVRKIWNRRNTCKYFKERKKTFSIYDLIRRIRMKIKKRSFSKYKEHYTLYKERATQKNNTSGYIGIDFHKQSNNWRARVKVAGKYEFTMYSKNIDEVIIARDKYIIENKLCRKLNTKESIR